MNKLFEKCRREIGFPSDSFKADLKRKIMAGVEYGADNSSEALLRSIRFPVRQEFKQSLREQLTGIQQTEHQPQQEQPAPVRHAHKSSFLPRFSSRKKRIFRLFEAATSVVVTASFFMGLLFFGSSLPTSASSTTYVSVFSGEVLLYREGHSETLETADISLGADSAISTGNDSGVEIRFFEDSVLRLDENSIVRIDQLSPHPSQKDLGEVMITVVDGRAWVRTYSIDEKYSRFVVRFDGGEVVLDNGGAIDIEVSSPSTEITTWDRTARVNVDQGEVLLAEGKRYRFLRHFRDGHLSDVGPTERGSLWVRGNLAEDQTTGMAFVSEKIRKREQEITSSLHKLKRAFVSPFSEKPNEEVQLMEELFFTTLTEFSFEGHSDTLPVFTGKARAVFAESPEDAMAFLASAEKTLASILPDSPVYNVKQTVEQLQAEFADEQAKIIVKEKRRTQRLWEAKKLADSGNVALAEEIVLQSSVPAEDEEPVPDSLAAEMMGEKQEQIAALDRIEEHGISPEATEKIEENILRESSTLIRPGFPAGEAKDLREKAYDVINSVKIYESVTGQRNTLRTRLDDIENSGENIDLLMEIRNRLPAELQSEVNDKISYILSVERDKVEHLNEEVQATEPETEGGRESVGAQEDAQELLEENSQVEEPAVEAGTQTLPPVVEETFNIEPDSESDGQAASEPANDGAEPKLNETSPAPEVPVDERVDGSFEVEVEAGETGEAPSSEMTEPPLETSGVEEPEQPVNVPDTGTQVKSGA